MNPAPSSAPAPVDTPTAEEHRRSDDAIVCATCEAARRTRSSLRSVVESIREARGRGDDVEAVRLAQLALHAHEPEVALMSDVHHLLALSLWAMGRESEAAKHYAIAMQALEWK